MNHLKKNEYDEKSCKPVMKIWMMIFLPANDCGAAPLVDNAEQSVLNGDGTTYGTVIQYDCNPGYVMATGEPLILCTANGWSGPEPQCECE